MKTDHVALDARTPAVTPIQPVQLYSGCDWVKLYSDWSISTARAVCMAESSGNPLATGYNSNGTADRGLMQVNSIHADMVGDNLQALYDPATNVNVAHRIWEAHGYNAWSSFLSGKYRVYL